MASIELEDMVLELDGDGFLTKPEIWNEDIARQIAKIDGIEELTDKHGSNGSNNMSGNWYPS